MLQVFHTDVVKVDRNVVIAIVCTRILQVYVPNVSSVFHMYIASVFISILHMFYTYIASVLSRCCVCFAMCFKCF
jgi:hypothetical protein